MIFYNFFLIFFNISKTELSRIHNIQVAVTRFGCKTIFIIIKGKGRDSSKARMGLELSLRVGEPLGSLPNKGVLGA